MLVTSTRLFIMLSCAFCASMDTSRANAHFKPSNITFSGTVPGNPDLGDGFGTTVRLNDHFIVVTAPNAQPYGNESAGVAYIYMLNGKHKWVNIQSISPLGSNDQFGAFQIDLENNFLLISALGTPLGPIPNETRANQDFSGAIQVYKLNRRIGEGVQWWTCVQTIDRFTPGLDELTLASPEALNSNQFTTLYQQGAHFGLQFHYDNLQRVLLVGAPYQEGLDENNNPIKNAGAVYVFKHDQEHGCFKFHQKITRPGGPKENDTFGANVRLWDHYALISNSPVFPAPRTGSNGSVYLYHCKDKEWRHIQTLKGDQQKPSFVSTLHGPAYVGDGFGSALAINDQYAVIGAGFESKGDGLPLSGAVYFYKFKHKPTRKSLAFQQKAFSNDPSVQGTALLHVALLGDNVLVSDPLHTGPNGQFHQGAALHFQRNDHIWKLKKVLFDPKGGTNDYFGYSVSLDREGAVIGASPYGVLPLTEYGNPLINLTLPLNPGKAVFFTR